MAKPTIPKQYLGAFKEGHTASARHYVDDELAHMLLARGSPADFEMLSWLAQFNNEYYKARIKKEDPKVFHKSKEMRRDVYSRTNARRRDVFGRNLVSSLDVEMVCFIDQRRIDASHEDLIIEITFEPK